MDRNDLANAGLTSEEARRRLLEDGPNALPAAERRGALALACEVAREPMFLLLIGAASVYLLLGDLREALVLAASIVVVMAITVVQERRTERALESLRELSSPRALVVRGGKETRVPGAEVVRGDLLLLREGDRVAADARLVESHDLLIDESLLTGESMPVEKRCGGAPDFARVLAGTLAVKGTGRAEVTATGPRSELGSIGASLAAVDRGKTTLELETARIVRYIAALGLAVCVLVAAGYFATRGDPLSAILAGLTLAMAVLPEEFPVVLTVFLALGAWRIAKHGVLTRRMPAIEMLGAATVILCDKTGTLTENRMEVAEAWLDGRWRPASAEPGQAPLYAVAALACEERPHDPMERAILAAARSFAPSHYPPPAAVLEHRHPLAEGFLAVCHGWRDAAGEARLAMKGAPETVLALCAMSDAAREAAHAAAAEGAARGLRLLAVAEARPHDSRWASEPAQYRWRFLGFVALADPLRPAVPAAIALLATAGIRVVMITGDHPTTAAAIARQAGIDARRVVTGLELEAIDDQALATLAASTAVFARVRPAQKLRLVNALRAAGEVVAMTGDGVNDAPALKAAHIGIAMGFRGTDVAREAAALVLVEDDFTAIAATVRLGRRIYDNIRNAMRYLLAVHVPLAGMALLCVATGWPLFVFPVHVVFLEFVIDPACSIVFEAERSDPHVMRRKPRPPGEPLFDRAALALGFALGLAVLAAVAAVYGWMLASARPEGEARALAFATLVAGNVALILVNRSHRLTAVEMAGRRNPALWWIVAATSAALGAVLYVPAAAGVFRFAPPHGGELAIALACGFAAVAWYDALKVARRRLAAP